MSRSAPDDEGVVQSVNVTWVGGSFLWLFYVLCLVGARAIFAMLPITNEAAWTSMNVAHGVIQFMGLHWSKGSPVWLDQGEYEKYTFWEQLDGGIPWTTSKKVLLIIPVVLFLLTSHYTNYETPYLYVNLFTVLVLVIGKLPEMHGVRLFGVNKTE